MAANTIAMYFKVEPVVVQEKGLPEGVLDGPNRKRRNLISFMTKFSSEGDTFWTEVYAKLGLEFRRCAEQLGVQALGELESEPVIVEMSNKGDALIVFHGVGNSHATLRIYSHGLLTFDIQHFIKDYGDKIYNLDDMQVKIFSLGNRKLQLSEEYIRTLEAKVRKHLGDYCIESNCLFAPIRRGQPVWSYAVTADERMMELDYDYCVFNKDSKWQNIKIVHSKEHGNVLFLDGDLMLGESDLIYTQTVAGIGSIDYRNKEVLILGGGDGGLIHELLKEQPKFVVMAEIDEEVVKACREHMRSVCGESMDEYEGPHHKIVIEDCVKVLHNTIQSNKKYDFIINDLTEFPVEKELRGYGYDFATTSLITELSLKALKPEGRMLARGNCLSAIDYRIKFEGDLKTLGLEYKRKDVYVPSFHETYCLYEMWRPS